MRRHPEVGQESGEQGIGPFVVDEEAGVGGHRATGQVDGDGVGVPAWPAVGLEDVDVVALLAQEVGGGHAGDAASDDGDAQGGAPGLKGLI